MVVKIRQFGFKDVPLKVKWINDERNNKYLHYDLPLELDKTENWFRLNEHNNNRYDAIIEVDGEPIGLIGLININFNKREAEYYITIGEQKYLGKGIALDASKELLKYAFSYLKLNKIYLTTETENIAMQKLAKKIGMLNEAHLMQHSSRNNQLHDVYYYSVLQEDFQNKIVYPEQILSGIDYLYNDDNDNSIYIKRDDMLSFSFGGNKARKAKYFFDEIKAKNFNVVITYGSKVSNHCRVISNMCSKLGIKCIIVSPISIEENNFNRTLIKLANAEIIECDVSDVSTTIENIIEKEKQIENQSVYFIPGGGHGNHGTQAYVDAYHEIVYWSRKNNKKFDYIFVASGTGTTQAGLIVGNIMHKNSTQIIGISIAREESVGKKVILDSVEMYLEEHGLESLIRLSQVNFTDKYINRAYGLATDEIYNKISSMYKEYGIQFNSIYTGKGFVGMEHFIKENNIKNNNILFIHTGGTPLFFEDLKKLVAE